MSQHSTSLQYMHARTHAHTSTNTHTHTGARDHPCEKRSLGQQRCSYLHHTQPHQVLPTKRRQWHHSHTGCASVHHQSVGQCGVCAGQGGQEQADPGACVCSYMCVRASVLVHILGCMLFAVLCVFLCTYTSLLTPCSININTHTFLTYRSMWLSTCSSWLHKYNLTSISHTQTHTDKYVLTLQSTGGCG